MVIATVLSALPREPLHGGVGGFASGTAVALLAMVLYASGSVLQHGAAARSTGERGLDLRRLVTRRRWLLGQSATSLACVLQVVALAAAPVSIVQPILAGALVVALAVRAVRDRSVPSGVELLGAACTIGGLVVFLGAARPALGRPQHMPPTVPVLTAVVVAVALAAGASRLPRGPAGALLCGAAAGIVAGTAAVLVSAAFKAWSDGARGLGVAAVVGALVVAVAAQLTSQQAYSRGALAWSLPALTLADPLAALPVARLLLGERLEPGHIAVWGPAALVAVIGVVLLARAAPPARS
jgi:hypothetical protein